MCGLRVLLTMIKHFLKRVLFWVLFPLLLLLGMVWWRGDSLFIISNINMALGGKRL
jgi:hypothetical protein